MATAKVTVETTAPAMLLPQELHGFIDLQTLEDIHRFLGDSELEDDLTLAAWIKQQYLYEPIQEDGRPVKTTESFAKLDHAYRRVRSLTNKAQDKWPFFDRKWKPMRSVLVKNNARGESAPGISLPGLEIAQDDAVDMERQSTPTVHASTENSTLILTASKQKKRTSPRQQKRAGSLASSTSITPHLTPSRAAINTDGVPPMDLNEVTELSDVKTSRITQDDDDTSKTSNIAGLEPDLREAADSVSQSINEEIVHSSRASSPIETGKVRGSKGKVVSQQQSTGAVKIEPGLSGQGTHQKCTSQEPEDLSVLDLPGDVAAPSIFSKTTAAATEVVNEVGTLGDPMTVDVVDTREQSALPNSGTASNRAISEESAQSLVNSKSSKYSSPTYKMAVESDSVVTNLDKFPPNSRKRKSEPSTQHNSPHKRARSSQMQRSARDVGSSNEKALSEPAASKPEDEEPMMVTRRSKRQTTRSSMSPPQSEQVVSSKSVKTTPQGEPIVQAQGSSVVTNRNTAPALSPKPKSTGTSKKATVTDEDMEVTTSVATGTTSTAKSDPRRSSSIPGKKVQLQKDDNPNVNGPNKNGKRAASPLRNYWSDDENEIRVDYFARVQLRRKVVEIPLMTKNLNKEAKVIEDYADFVEAHDAADSISFGLYKGLVEDHGKKGRGKGKKK